jgi:hypothetical protein
VGDFETAGDVMSDTVPECSLFVCMAVSERVPLPAIRVAYFACVALSVRFAGLRPHLTLHDLERFELRIESAIELVPTSASQK